MCDPSPIRLLYTVKKDLYAIRTAYITARSARDLRIFDTREFVENVFVSFPAPPTREDR